MNQFMLELYVSRLDRGAAIDSAERARLAAEQLQREGTAVRFLRSIFVPEDETCLLVYEAVSADNVRRSARLAGLPVEHIVEVLAVEAEASHAQARLPDQHRDPRIGADFRGRRTTRD